MIIPLRRFRSATMIILAVCMLAWLPPATSTAAPRQLEAPYAAALEQALSDTDGIAPGVTLMVRVPGRGEWIGAHGVANRATGEWLQPEHGFRIASVSKLFLATVVLQLAQEDVVKLDTPLAAWLPGIVPAADRITLRHLLSHTSGLYDYMDGPFIRAIRAQPQRVFRPHELVAYAAQRPMVFSPGAPGRWRYSNTNYVLLGMVVEKATGDSLANQIRRRILEPLNLASTFFDPDEQNTTALTHAFVGKDDMAQVNMSFAWGAGNMVSTAPDLARFGDALLHGRLLKPALMAELQDFIATGANPPEYGLGLMRKTLPLKTTVNGQPLSPEARTVLGHTGGLLGYRTVLWYLPSRGITVVAAANTMSADPNIVATRAIDALLAVDPHFAATQ